MGQHSGSRREAPGVPSVLVKTATVLAGANVVRLISHVHSSVYVKDSVHENFEDPCIV